MLVLGRSKGDKILIGDDIIVTLEDVHVESAAITVQEGVCFPYRIHLREGHRHQVIPDVFLELLRVRRGQARFGIEAPRSVRIMRSEVARKLEDRDKMLGHDLGGEAGGA